MTNTTVKELIEALKEMDQEAVVCYADPFSESLQIYSSLEVCFEEVGALYLNDSGDMVTGNVVCFG